VLVLFDIDGTLLLRSGGAHLAAMADAVGHVTGVRPQLRSDGVTHVVGGQPVNGMVDAQIADVMLRSVGSTSGGVEIRRVLGHLGPAYRRALSSGATYGSVAPGVTQLLDRLDEAGARVGLATGNVRAVANSKLSAAGLWQRFSCGGFSDTVLSTRREVVAVAVAHASPGEDVWVVGDTPADVDAAHDNGAKVVAVATGAYRPGDLSEAEVVAADLTSPSVVGALTAHR
jgi:phosphoglycolate phosphatase